MLNELAYKKTMPGRFLWFKQLLKWDYFSKPV